MVPFLGRIAACATGVDDPDLWSSIYKPSNSGGGPFSGGWITQLFPYLLYRHRKSRRRRVGVTQRNTYLGQSDIEPKSFSGVTTDQWPPGTLRGAVPVE